METVYDIMSMSDHMIMVNVLHYIIIITSSGDLQPSIAIANQSLGKSVSAD